MSSLPQRDPLHEPVGSQWLDLRTGLNSIARHALEEPIPGGARWAYVLGSALVFLFLSQVLTGVALALYYVPSATDAHLTVAYIVKVVSAGSFVRSLHAYGASALIIVLLLHVIQTFFYGAYKGRRELVWIAGSVLLALILGMAFTGYLLPWDQKAYFATAVGTNVMSEVPFVGNLLKEIIRGGNDLGTFTLSRFFVLHVFVISALIIGFIILHVALFRKAGPAGPVTEDALNAQLPTEPFYPRQFGKDFLFVALLMTALAALSYFSPIRLGPEANPSDVAYIPRPEWYFLPMFQWLKLWPGKTVLIGVVVLPSIVTFLFVAVPFLDRGLQRRPLRRPLATGCFCAVLGGMSLLGAASAVQDSRDPAVSAQLQKQERAVQAFMNAPFGREAVTDLGPGVKTAEQVFKNIQVLQGTRADELVLGMHIVEGQLGVDCVYCHVDHNAQHFSLDDKPAKQTARRMITMVRNINQNSFGGQPVVTCYTCHQGHPQPVSTVRLPLSSDELEEKPASNSSMPSVDQIFAKYVEALGGDQAQRRIRSRVIIGTQDLASGPGGKIPLPAQIEIYRQAPNLELTAMHVPGGVQYEGFDGKAAWSTNDKGVVSDLAAIDQLRARRAASFYQSLELRSQYNQIIVNGIEKVEGHDAYLLLGFPANDTADRLYFDVQSGLLLRKISMLPTPLGDSPFQVDYLDYRDTGTGVKFPYVQRMTPGSPRSEPQTHSTLKVKEVRDNVPIESEKFKKPLAKTAIGN